MAGSISKNSAVGAIFLGTFALVASLMVAATFQNTKQRIAENERNYLLKNLNTLIDDSRHDNDLLADVLMLGEVQQKIRMVKVYRARLGGESVGLIMEVVTRKGYGGPIKLLLALDRAEVVLGVRVVSHKETPGLGDAIEIERSNWIEQFNGQSLQSPMLSRWRVKKDGGDFDQLSGATITPRSIVEAVKETLLYVQENKARLYASTNQEVQQ